MERDTAGGRVGDEREEEGAPKAEGGDEGDLERVLVTLTPSEAKRLIAKAVAAMKPVRKALREGIVVVCLGTTNAFVAEELTGDDLGRGKGRFAIGIVTPRGTCVSKAEGRLRELVIERGRATGLGLKDVLGRLGPSDVFIKGANAVDPWGNAGVYLGSETGGTVGLSIGTVLARGVRVIVPVSLEKLVPLPATDLVQTMGNMRFRRSMGMPVGMMPLPGEVVTEVEAVGILFGCCCIPAGGGGVSGAEGARCYVLEGSAEETEAAWEGIAALKGEPPVESEAEECGRCTAKCPGRRR